MIKHFLPFLKEMDITIKLFPISETPGRLFMMVFAKSRKKLTTLDATFTEPLKLSGTPEELERELDSERIVSLISQRHQLIVSTAAFEAENKPEKKATGKAAAKATDTKGPDTKEPATKKRSTKAAEPARPATPKLHQFMLTMKELEEIVEKKEGAWEDDMLAKKAELVTEMQAAKAESETVQLPLSDAIRDRFNKLKEVYKELAQQKLPL